MEHKMEKDMPKHGESHKMPTASGMDIQKMHKEMGTEHKKEHGDKVEHKDM